MAYEQYGNRRWTNATNTSGMLLEFRLRWIAKLPRILACQALDGAVFLSLAIALVNLSVFYPCHPSYADKFFEFEHLVGTKSVFVDVTMALAPCELRVHDGHGCVLDMSDSANRRLGISQDLSNELRRTVGAIYSGIVAYYGSSSEISGGLRSFRESNRKAGLSMRLALHRSIRSVVLLV